MCERVPCLSDAVSTVNRELIDEISGNLSFLFPFAFRLLLEPLKLIKLVWMSLIHGINILY